MIDADIRFVGNLARVEVRPGDVFVVQTDNFLSSEVAERIRTALSSDLGAPVIILQGGLKLGVVGSAE